MAKNQKQKKPESLANSEKLKNANLVHTSVLEITKTDPATQPDLRSPEERNKGWHRPPEDIREEKKLQSESDEVVDTEKE
jgi:hypothetical protein